MASALWNYLGLRETPTAPTNEAVRALPASWYTSQEMFELERRAIFSRKWLLTTHKLRLPNTGDWLQYEVSGFNFVLVRDKEGNINAFHNVCRHRAFPLVTEEKGSARIFACKYHGWSYGLNGKLAKAPGYQDLDGFDKSKNSLLPIHVHLDANGFIWVNLDAGEQPEISWDDDFKGIDLQSRFADVKWEDYTFDHTWEQDGDYNWKILADNYNECYHCATTHPDIPALADLATYSVDTKDGGIIHDAHSKPDQIAAGLRIASTYYFPNASMTVSPHFFFMQRFVPISPTRSVMKYEVYRNKNSSDEDFELINTMYKRIMSEDKYLCDLTQKNLNAGVFVNGELHPKMEKGPLYFQKVVRDVVTEHFQREEKEGQEYWPARQRVPKEAATSAQDMQFCANLGCGAAVLVYARHEDVNRQSFRGCTQLPLDFAVADAPPQKDRLAELEEKVNLILNGNILARSTGPETKLSPPSPRRRDSHTPYPVPSGLGEGTTPHSSPSVIARAINLYVEHCHRQPVWCFDFDGPGEPGSLPEELICSLLALTLRYLHEQEQGQHYADDARTLIMLRIANGTVELATIESLCLLSYSSFIDGNTHLGQFYLGLASQLCRAAMLDVAVAYSTDDPHMERKKRLFWSLQLLEQSYGRQTGILRTSTEIWRPPYFATDGDQDSHKATGPPPPPMPQDSVGCTNPHDTGIWNMSNQFGWVWSNVRGYVSDCARSKMKEPWRHESMYSMILSDLTEVENRTPFCHRYDHVQFYERTGEELSYELAYWVPWLKLQFMYHAILTVLNHPFLYIMASRQNPNLAIPNSFWRRSSELVVLHATWIVRLIDMVVEKEVRLSDPFFAHVAAIAATVQLYYCCAGDPRLKYKSRVDYAKCREFLRTFATTSRACEGLHRILDQMMRIASGSENVDYETWLPSKIYLSIPLMWDILQFNVTDRSAGGRADGRLLHSSLAASAAGQGSEEDSTLEVIVTTSPEVTVNTADGGQAVPLPLYRTPATSKANAAATSIMRDTLVAPIDSLMVNTPWLWADSAPLGDMESSLGYANSGPGGGDAEFSSWWNLGNL
ncbi:hypothetical protein AtubIFM57258_009200 [Aspergillus tubingensis]|nr:hypothetical protein AtubIFM57258_009200 [Aspergillus tubingensis]